MKNLSAINLIKFIANDYLELSQEKIAWQRDNHMQLCKDWLEDQNARDRCERIEDEFFDWSWLDKQ